MPTDADWVRLGDLLIRRRIDLNPDYANRTVFADKRNIGYRLVGDIETGRRTNYGLATKIFIARAYELDDEALDRALAGGELVPAAPMHLVTQADDPGDTSDADDEDELALRRELAEAREELRQAKAQLAAIRAAVGTITDA